jgi:molybdenum cofactor cytidylyltransferase
METSVGQHDGESQIGVIILAAGASTRMGRPKQLLLHRGQTLLRRTVETALASVCRPVVVVLGAHVESVRNELEQLPAYAAENPEWNKGMSSSIRIGLETLIASNSEVDGAVIMLCDQPLVTAGVINELVEARRETGKAIVASAYGETRGVPALFSRQLFAEIASLKVNEGARQVIASHPDDVATVDFPEGAIDVDTPQDYEFLRKGQRRRRLKEVSTSSPFPSRSIKSRHAMQQER